VLLLTMMLRQGFLGGSFEWVAALELHPLTIHLLLIHPEGVSVVGLARTRWELHPRPYSGSRLIRRPRSLLVFQPFVSPFLKGPQNGASRFVSLPPQQAELDPHLSSPEVFVGPESSASFRSKEGKISPADHSRDHFSAS
jgi:hypothetical protein